MSLEELISPENLKRGMLWNKPKTELMLQFEKETKYNAIYHNKITGKFTHWLFKKGYKTSNFSEVNQTISKAIKEYRKNMVGEKAPFYGRHHSDKTKEIIGKAKIKEDAGKDAIHEWINKHFPQKEICDDKCEICNKINLSLDLARFIHIKVRNIKDPMIDYLYICPRIEKNSCHRIYDDNLSDNQKEKILSGAITREEKLKRIRRIVLGIKKEI